ncbi:MAG: Valine-tRNA ligase [Candidatus Nomurabacteria bacterium GW2011_GWB1_37_5]|uniref:valine--tRNA ligase n=1 Tax=Candidatus Nomurabacteria bacterium GW2011_GWB1_37_5 TaxID=1618742 RepID=A0A0G0H9J2_9BACT|nr:MAG: Valine-tRNA ligase [Candidatus Nomurabacteria bacterium GW2011_GWB1_37_5]
MSIDERLLKPYDPESTESRIYKLWEESGFFSPEKCIESGVTKSDAKPFTIIMPPPNVTGILHMGHASMLTVEDIMIRYHRMKGDRTLWLPGTDHAAIATQSKVEKEIQKKEGKNRHDLGRDELVRRIETFAKESHDTIVKQIKIMGSSCDWSREAFTLDEKRSLAVRTMFKQMYDDGLIYRGHRVINWDPKGQTTVSDDEIVYEERKAKMYTFKYSKDFPISISTTRPETKVGDTAVAVHPDDIRYKEYVGKEYDAVFCGVPIHIKIIADPSVEKDFGTGALGVTPAHSTADWEMAQRHNLPLVQVINEYAKMTVTEPSLNGKKTIEAREIIVEWLRKEGLLEKEEEISQNISTAERTGGIIEPLPKLQWFVAVNKEITGRGKTLKDLMREPVASSEIKIIPEYFNKTYFNWIDNLRDWCISRQIWYGHRIPVWYDKDGKVHLPKEQKIILARHGESEGNVKKIYSGHQDSPLTEKGVGQAEIIGQSLKYGNVTKIISSDLSRAHDTAKIIKNYLNISDDIETLKDLREVDPGEFTNMPTDGTSIMVKAFESKEGESYENLAERAKRVLERIKTIKTDGSILIVSHNSFLAALSSLIEERLDKNSMINMRSDKPLTNTELREYTLQIVPDPIMEQDPDTLDTWFSSALWTFSTLGWPKKTKDLEIYHPTDVLETGYEILFFWVARMILFTEYELKTIPFHTIYLHGTIRDAQGRKMSKSLGNGIDPMDIAAKYGADAGRMALVIGTAPGTDIKLAEDKIKGYKHFSNKIWNITRFVIENTNDIDYAHKPELSINDKELLNELNNLIHETTDDIDNYRFYLAGEKIYHYVWHRFADIIIEDSKKIFMSSHESDKISRKWIIFEILQNSLKLLHPFMPFVTEELWQIIQKNNKTLKQENNLLMVEKWPEQAR